MFRFIVANKRGYSQSYHNYGEADQSTTYGVNFPNFKAHTESHEQHPIRLEFFKFCGVVVEINELGASLAASRCRVFQEAAAVIANVMHAFWVFFGFVLSTFVRVFASFVSVAAPAEFSGYCGGSEVRADERAIRRCYVNLNIKLEAV